MILAHTSFFFCRMFFPFLCSLRSSALMRACHSSASRSFYSSLLSPRFIFCRRFFNAARSLFLLQKRTAERPGLASAVLLCNRWKSQKRVTRERKGRNKSSRFFYSGDYSIHYSCFLPFAVCPSFPLSERYEAKCSLTSVFCTPCFSSKVGVGWSLLWVGSEAGSLVQQCSWEGKSPPSEPRALWRQWKPDRVSDLSSLAHASAAVSASALGCVFGTSEDQKD